MQFMSNVLPMDVDRWEISDGSMTTTQLILHSGATAQASIKKTELAYIPKAFMLRVRFNHDTDWRNADVSAALQIKYEGNTRLYAKIPLNRVGYVDTEILSENVIYITSDKYSSCTFIFKNSSDEDVIFSAFELLPSIDMDAGQEQSVEALLPQLVYAYNESAVTLSAGAEMQIIQLPVSISKSTNLLVHATVSGSCVADDIQCTIKIDGETVRTFPVKQTFLAGHFYFGIPSIIPFVQSGPHMVTLHLTTTSGAATVAQGDAVLVLEGKSVLGGASGDYPHAEVFTEIWKQDIMNWNLDDEAIVENISPDSYSVSTTIPSFNISLQSNVSFSIITYGFIYDCMDESKPMPLETTPTHVYKNFRGIGADTSAVFNGTTNTYEAYRVDVLEVTKEDFDPVYSIHYEEVK